MNNKYARERTKRLANLADHFHDRVLEQDDPKMAARWLILSDVTLWAAYGDGEVEDSLRQFRNGDPS